MNDNDSQYKLFRSKKQLVRMQFLSQAETGRFFVGK